MREQHPQWRKVVAALALCVLLSACSDKQPEKPTEASEAIERETDLMSDPARAGPELEKRLAGSVSVDGGLLLVHADTLGLYVLPVSTPWTLQCTVGMSIVFGNSETNNNVTVNLSTGYIDPKNCDVLAPRIGKRLLAILGQDQAHSH
jgi:hypothetical protein